ncbi:MAG: hypothetical protein WA416_06060 [Candidatus Sulfotelmatobacter sp.]
MDRRFGTPLILLASCSLLLAQRAEQENKVPTAAELRAITARGRMLAEYDVASWHATDVVQDLKPEKGSTRYYIARKSEAGWVVVFGRLNDTHDKFLAVYQATQGTRPEFFTAKKCDPPLASTDFYLYAAKAFETSLKDLGPVSRPYNAYAIPSETGQLYVYLLPAQTENGIYPLGGDVRYTFTADGGSMVERRQMHKSILDFAIKKDTVSGYHTHVLSLTPEDSDVFYVLTRKPSIPEYVGTLDGKIYVIQTDGTILLGK